MAIIILIRTCNETTGLAQDGSMRLKHTRSIICSIALLFFAPTTAIARANAYFWAPLTPLELKVINNAKDARSGDADALLALALITSGDIRQQQTFGTIQKQMHQFIRRIRPSIDQQPTVYAKGEKLLKAMHDHYFTGSQYGGGDLVDGYNAEQSKFSAIFQNGQFNCVSSAILYIVLARYFDLTALGVVTSQHAFVQLNGPNGRKIDVETTSKGGYGLIHDKQFYEERFADFSSSRNLIMPTYEDYLNRRVLSPFMLIIENMNNQHTHINRMDQRTRNRLFEIQGYLDRNNAASQINRLGVYQNSMISLLNTGNSRNAKALIRVIEPVVDQIKSQPWIRHIRNKDVKVIWERLGAIHTLWGHLLMADNHYDAAERRYKGALQWAKTASRKTQAQIGIHKARAFRAFDKGQWHKAITAYQHLLSYEKSSDSEGAQQTRENIAAAYWNWGNAAAMQSDWLAAAAHYDAVDQWIEHKDTIQKAQVAKLNAYAMHHFTSKRWEKSIRYYKEAMALQNKDQQARTQQSIGSAYINWGNTLFHKKKYGPALQKYETAMNLVNKKKKALVHRNVFSVYRNLTAGLIKNKKYNKALILIKPSTQRFPDCTPCQREIARLTKLAAAHQKQKK